jgi:hypothetical protein
MSVRIWKKENMCVFLRFFGYIKTLVRGLFFLIINKSENVDLKIKIKSTKDVKC